jgi:hypothetical protein
MTDRNKKSEKRSFTGDIDAQASIKVTRNDRSVALTLTKTLMKKIGFRGNRLFAAAVELEPGHSILLMMDEQTASGHLNVLRTGEGRLELVLQSDDEVEVDDLTEAFLTIKRAQLEKGDMRLSGPMSADDWARHAQLAYNTDAKT